MVHSPKKNASPPPAAERKGKRQRFYARNALKTTLDPGPRSMLGGARAFDAIVLGHHAIPHDPTQVHPALTSFADECCGTLARLLAYVGVPALLAITGIHLWDELSAGEAGEPSAKTAGARLRGLIPRSPPVTLIFLKRKRVSGFSASPSRPQGCLFP